MGTACGRATVCLSQSASRVVSIDVQDQSTAAEWASRYSTSDRLEYGQADVGRHFASSNERFGLVFVDTEHDAASVRRDLELAIRLVEPGGLIAVHDYPDPSWPDVRLVVDEFAGRFDWNRTVQADYLAVFRTLSTS
jgi:predicted O-methyltransferase YrrM